MTTLRVLERKAAAIIQDQQEKRDFTRNQEENEALFNRAREDYKNGVRRPLSADELEEIRRECFSTG